MNEFVNYLDQYNVLSPNHAKIYDEYTDSKASFQFKIKTNIEDFIIKLFDKKPRSLILTGNAGDGKTRLCRTVYETFSGQTLTEWPECGIVDVPYGNGCIRIVKDLSELKEDIIFKELNSLQDQVLNDHSNRVYYLIAANEGKLTKSLISHPELQQLSRMVSNRFSSHEHNDDRLHLINLQDVTSSIYAKRILDEWNKNENWYACQKCPKQTQCIIYLNHVRTSVDQIKERLVEQYRLLDCLGIHVTMREILIHISYVLTGGLTCQDILNASYKNLEVLANYVYYENFYGLHMPDVSSGELGAIRHFRYFDPGNTSVSVVDDFILNGDMSGDEQIENLHSQIFNNDLDMLFGFYKKHINLYRTHHREDEQKFLFNYMPRFRRKYFFEIGPQVNDTRELLIPYRYFYRYLKALNDKQTQYNIRKDLITGLNRIFSKRLVSKRETQLLVVNEHLMIHQAISLSSLKIIEMKGRDDIDFLPSKFILQVNGCNLEVQLPVFEYLLRIANGGLFVTLKQDVEILINTFKNELIKNSDVDEYQLTVLALNNETGEFVPHIIDLP
ncbi:hypothetical protein ACT91Q_21010 [Brevibacillus thermoruber]|jgi:hypothetical protein|uniref:hypothetical protein n=1 Tax=Brevibacillus thermoruber TaxID=33942 RepID=UPI0040410878